MSKNSDALGSCNTLTLTSRLLAKLRGDEAKDGNRKILTGLIASSPVDGVIT